jgi:transposase
MCQASATVENLYPLVQEFFRLLRARQGNQLDCWFRKVEASGIPELQRFADGLVRDKAAGIKGSR